MLTIRLPILRMSLLLVVAFVLQPAMSLAQAAPVGAPSVTLRQIDGQELIGQWSGCTANEIHLELPSGRSVAVPLDDISVVTFSSQRIAPRGDVTFYLDEGGLLVGRLIDGYDDGVVAATTVGDSLRLPFDRLVALRLAQPDEFIGAEQLFRDALANVLPGEDSLITRSIDDAKLLRGRFERLGPASAAFLFGGRTRTMATRKIYAVVFAGGAADETVSHVTVELADGSRLPGDLLSADDLSLRVDAAFGETVSLALRSVAALRVHSTRVVHVSSMKPQAIHAEGRLHRPWPVRFDRNVSGGPMRIDGQLFESGIGVHSRTYLTYDIGGEYVQFAATIGLDDLVRPAGSVVFRVRGDGRILFDSGVLLGSDPAREILIGVQGVERLSLEVDYGDAWDFADQADWGGARLIRPPGRSPRGGGVQ